MKKHASVFIIAVFLACIFAACTAKSAALPQSEEAPAASSHLSPNTKSENAKTTPSDKAHSKHQSSVSGENEAESKQTKSKASASIGGTSGKSSNAGDNEIEFNAQSNSFLTTTGKSPSRSQSTKPQTTKKPTQTQNATKITADENGWVDKWY